MTVDAGWEYATDEKYRWRRHGASGITVEYYRHGAFDQASAWGLVGLFRDLEHACESLPIKATRPSAPTGGVEVLIVMGGDEPLELASIAGSADARVVLQLNEGAHLTYVLKGEVGLSVVNLRIVERDGVTELERAR